jgi:hypothetical protein
VKTLSQVWLGQQSANGLPLPTHSLASEQQNVEKSRVARC